MNKILVFMIAVLISSEIHGQVYGSYLYPLNQYESAFIRSNHKVGIKLMDYFSVVSLHYSVVDSSNSRVTFNAGNGSIYPSLTKRLFSIADLPICVKLSSGILSVGYFYDVKILFGIYQGNETTTSCSFTYGRYLEMKLGDDKYMSFDVIIETQFFREFDFGFGLGINQVSDEINEFDIKTKEISNVNKRIQYGVQLGFYFLF